MLNFVKRLFTDSRVEKPAEKEPFLELPCKQCNHTLVIKTFLFPGQAAALNCDNCSQRWVIFVPQARIFTAKEFSPVWDGEFEMAEGSARG